MTSISPFPLFNLPFVAIYEVLKENMPIELIQLSSVSKKTTTIVKSFIKRNSSKINYKLEVGLRWPHDRLEIDLWHGDNDKLLIRFRTVGDRSHKDIEYSKVARKFDSAEMFVNVDYDANVFSAFCQDAKITSKNMLQYLCKLFNPIISVNGFGNESLTVEVFDVIWNEKAKLDELTIVTSRENTHLYQEFLELSIRKLNLWSFPSNSFQYKPSKEPMKFEELDILCAQWVTNLEDFLHCKRVHLYNSRLTKSDLNRFLKKWMKSDCQLEYLEFQMDMNKPNLREIIEGLPVEPLNRARIDNNFQDFKDGECFSFQRNDGAKAIICQDCTYIILQTESYRSS